MYEFLSSNFSPLKTHNRTFEDVFYEKLGRSKEVKIASGYISEDAITQLIGIYDNGFCGKLELIVGMHYFDGFTRLQFDALNKLSNKLEISKLGKVSLATVSRYHGKLYSFKSENNSVSTIIGSSNLSKIHTFEKIYDSDLLVENEDLSMEIDSFISNLSASYCTVISSIDNSKIKFIKRSDLFNDHTDVVKVESPEKRRLLNMLTDVKFELPLKAEAKSGLNAFHGKGRQNPSNGIVIPRDWYEAELIISKIITSSSDYPKKDTEFFVVTDDGYKFKCKTSGDNSKNFRSAADLKVLGRWIKGRLENNGSLQLGEMVTRDTFSHYGRSTVSLIKTRVENTWFLDFGVKL